MPDYSRYGLKDNPYRTGELDPLGNPLDEKRLAEVDGFVAHKQRVDGVLQTAVANRKPAFFLVAGSSGTGRSTVANWILSRYANHLGLPRERLLVPKRKVDSRDDFDVLRNWFAFLDNRIDDEDDIDLGKKVDETLAVLPGAVQRETMVPAFARVARRVAIALQTQKDPTGNACPAAYAVCLEKVEEYRIIRAALDVFEEVPTVGVFTTFGLEHVGEEMLALFRLPSSTSRHVIQLGLLSAAEVGLVLDRRWREASLNPNDPPFDPATLEQTLGTPPRSLGRVLRLMSRLIDVKLAEPSSPLAWPNNPDLRLTVAQIQQLLPILEPDYGP